MPRTNDLITSAFDRWPVSTSSSARSSSHVDRVKCRYCGWTRAMNASRQRAHLDSCAAYLASRSRAPSVATSSASASASASTSAAAAPAAADSNTRLATPDEIHALHLQAAMSIYMTAKPFNHWENPYARSYHAAISRFANYAPPGREAVGSTLLSESYARVRDEVMSIIGAARWVSIVFDAHDAHDEGGGGAVTVSAIAASRAFHIATSDAPPDPAAFAWSRIEALVGPDGWWRVNAVVADPGAWADALAHALAARAESAHVFIIPRGSPPAPLAAAARLLDPRAPPVSVAHTEWEAVLTLLGGDDGARAQLAGFVGRQGEFSGVGGAEAGAEVASPAAWWEGMGVWVAPGLAEVAMRVYGAPGVGGEHVVSAAGWSGEGRGLGRDKEGLLRFVVVNRAVLDRDLG
ncbi:hypothetical protein EDC01DRAFT_634070 [Geopyxis carbonaria]|nr:hypothetical protein EDC01DRAFT_634070 [Geopyxis carbonaria]